MKESAEKRSDLLSMGSICDLYGVTGRTLRIYDEKGLIKPAYVNPDTGYRYYTADQCADLDVISELQVMGFSLLQIGRLLKVGDLNEIRAALLSRLHALAQEARRIEIAQSVANGFLEQCSIMLDPPICDQIQLEFIPERKVLVYDVPQGAERNGSYDLRVERSLQGFRAFLGECGFPKSVHPRMITAIPQENLANDSFESTKYYVQVDDIGSDAFDKVETLPAAQCLTMFASHNEASVERLLGTDVQLIRRMMDYARHKGFSVVGDVLCEVKVDTSLFGYRGHDFFFKLIMPVKRSRSPR